MEVSKPKHRHRDRDMLHWEHLTKSAGVVTEVL